MDDAPGEPREHHDSCSLSGNRVGSIAGFISDAAGDEPTLVHNSGVGSHARRDDVADAGCTDLPILERSFKRRSARSVTLFVIGYAAIWMAAGGVFLMAKFGLSLLAPQSYLPAVAVGFMGFVWQCSPIKQRCLNRGHNHRELAAFGIAADFDALRFGITHAGWCVGSCWALMLFPLVLPQGHFAAMAAVTFLMVSERLEQPKRLSWRLRLSRKLMRIVVAQTRIRLHGLR